jgi:hypothetical protein
MSNPCPGEGHEPQQSRPPYGRPPGDPGEPYAQYGQPGQPGHPPAGEYPAGGQQAYPPGPTATQPRGTNVTAVLSLVFAFVFAPVGIVLGHLARRQIRQTGEQGDQLARWGLVLGYVFTGLYLAGCCAWLGLVLWAGNNNSPNY